MVELAYDWGTYMPHWFLTFCLDAYSNARSILRDYTSYNPK